MDELSFIKTNFSSDKTGILVQRINNQEEKFLAFDQKNERFMTFKSNGRDQLLTEVEYIHFYPSHDFLGVPEIAKPLFFGLHPEYANGEQWVMTIELQAILKDQATG